MLAHLGSQKTIDFLRDYVWWKTIVNDVQKYCASCMTCKRSKPANQKPYGLLNPLPVPSTPWDAIGVDFVGPLPESKNRDGVFDSITVIIDLLTAMVHLVPSRINYTTRQVAELIFAEVYKHHGLQQSIISERDVLFTSQFWNHLHSLIGVKLRMSSAYHPETDGSTERANRPITQMLRQCVSPDQRDWVLKLPAIEFAINLARSDSTGYAPFFLNTGRMPRPMIWRDAPSDEFPAVRVFAQKVKNAIMAAHDSILAKRVKQTRDANRRRQLAPFAENDLVYISTKNVSLPKGLARKLTPKYIGPYKIVRDFGNNSYMIDLPTSMKQRGVHNVFHSSLLRVHEPNDDRLFPGRLDSQITGIGGQSDEWAIEKITAHTGCGENTLFEVLWSSGDKTWVPYSTIANLAACRSYLEALGADSIADLKSSSNAPLEEDPQVFLGSLCFLGWFPIKPPREVERICLPSTVSSTTSFLLPTVHHQSSLAMPLPHFKKLKAFVDTSLHPAVLRFEHGIALPDSESGAVYEFTNSQLRLYKEHSDLVKSGGFDIETHTVPAGYDLFISIFHKTAGPDCPYRFADIHDPNPKDAGQSIPIDDLAPDDVGPSPELLEELENLRRLVTANSIRQEQGKAKRLAIRKKGEGFHKPYSTGDNRGRAHLRRMVRETRNEFLRHDIFSNNSSLNSPDLLLANLGPELAGPSNRFDTPLDEFSFPLIAPIPNRPINPANLVFGSLLDDLEEDPTLADNGEDDGEIYGEMVVDPEVAAAAAAAGVPIEP